MSKSKNLGTRNMRKSKYKRYDRESNNTSTSDDTRRRDTRLRKKVALRVNHKGEDVYMR